MGHVEEAVPVLLRINHTNPGERLFPLRAWLLIRRSQFLVSCPSQPALGDSHSPHALEQVLHLFQEMEHPKVQGGCCNLQQNPFFSSGFVIFCPSQVTTITALVQRCCLNSSSQRQDRVAPGHWWCSGQGNRVD